MDIMRNQCKIQATCMTFLRSTKGKPRRDTHKNEIFKDVGIKSLIQLTQFSHVKWVEVGY
jgi:hypothetical protein